MQTKSKLQICAYPLLPCKKALLLHCCWTCALGVSRVNNRHIFLSVSHIVGHYISLHLFYFSLYRNFFLRSQIYRPFSYNSRLLIYSDKKSPKISRCCFLLARYTLGVFLFFWLREVLYRFEKFFHFSHTH